MDNADCRTAPATPGLLKRHFSNCEGSPMSDGKTKQEEHEEEDNNGRQQSIVEEGEGKNDPLDGEGNRHELRIESLLGFGSQRSRKRSSTKNTFFLYWPIPVFFLIVILLMVIFVILAMLFS